MSRASAGGSDALELLCELLQARHQHLGLVLMHLLPPRHFCPHLLHDLIVHPGMGRGITRTRSSSQHHVVKLCPNETPCTR